MKRIVFGETKAPEGDMQECRELTQRGGVVDMFLTVFDVLDIAREDANTPARSGPECSKVLLRHPPQETELFNGCPVVVHRVTYTCHDILPSYQQSHNDARIAIWKEPIYAYLQVRQKSVGRSSKHVPKSTCRRYRGEGKLLKGAYSPCIAVQSEK